MTIPGLEVDLSIVVPLLNEEENVGPLVEAVRAALRASASDGSTPRWELLLVDDGSTDGTARAMRRAAAGDERIRPLHLARRYGQTAAMRAGFDHARAPVVVSMDGDLQNDPADIPLLLRKLEEGYDLVVGFRVDRKDAFLTRRLPSNVANRLMSRLTGIPVRDSGCSLKAFRGALLDRLTLYSDMHRFIPVLAAATAGARIAEVPVRHHPRTAGRSKYGLRRTAHVLADLAAVKVIRSLQGRPLILFAGGAGIAGAVSVLLGGLAVGVHLALPPDEAFALVLPGAALIVMGFAAYLLLLGLVAEVAVERWSRRSPVRPPLVPHT